MYSLLLLTVHGNIGEGRLVAPDVSILGEVEDVIMGEALLLSDAPWGAAVT